MERQTTRLTLRPFKAEDVTTTYVDWLRDPVVTRFSNQRFRHHDLTSCREYQKSFDESENSFLIIESHKTFEAIGTMTIYCNPHHGTADIGLMIGNKDYWGKGLGLEAWKCVMEFLLRESKIRKITGGTARPNKAMTRIMEQSGMTLEATRQQHELIEGKAVDLLYYSCFSKGMA